MARIMHDSVAVPDLSLEELRRRIVYEDDDLLVIDKSAGWPVHGDRHHAGSQTLLALARQYLPKPRSDFQPAFIHRLDKETSGLMVLAKTREALRSLNRQLKFKKIRKIYLAILVGEAKPQGLIRLPLQKQLDRERWLALMVPVRRGGFHAQTDYRRLELFEFAGERFSLVEARPRTGRTHQLRAHFAAVGCPIVGDSLYGQVELNQELRTRLRIERQLLHAATLEFSHPMSGARLHFESPLPDDFSAAVEKLREGR
jgi:RluA family pseudouridine synthase